MSATDLIPEPDGLLAKPSLTARDEVVASVTRHCVANLPAIAKVFETKGLTERQKLEAVKSLLFPDAL